jgi:amidase
MSSEATLLAETAVELRRRIGSKALSPVELTRACIAQIERINPAVNAITATGFERAIDEARVAERAVMRGETLGLLHGLPMGIKDLQDTAGLLTTHGSPAFRNHVPERDSVMVARLRRAGAIVLAKTNVPEFGAGANSRNPVWGATGNPFNPMLNAGGSSGGSAAALACDMVPLASGSDTGGSLRIPAAKCGVVGFRPSPGLVPTERAFGWSPISVQGPMGRTVADTRLQLAAQTIFEDCDPLAWPGDGLGLAPALPVDLGTLRVAYTEDFGTSPVSEEIRAVFRAKVAAMKHLFRACEPVAFDFQDADRCFDVIRASQYLARHREAYEKDPAAMGPNVRANYEMGAAMSMADYAWAHSAQSAMFKRFQKTFREYDLVISPTTPVSPFPWTDLYLKELDGTPLRNYYHWLSLTYVMTLMTNPAISMPCGRDEREMPFGLQVVGPFRGDGFLLDASEALEAAFSHIPALTRPRPDLSRLEKPVPELRAIATHPPQQGI